MLFELVVGLFITLSSGEIEVIDGTIPEYHFRSETGCYIAGTIELNKLIEKYPYPGIQYVIYCKPV